jgi:type II secretory pathway component PulC
VLLLTSTSVLALALVLPPGQLPEDLRAVGVVFAPAPEKRAAVLVSAGRTRVVQPGDTAFGVRLMAVHADRVEVEAGGGAVFLPIAAGSVAATPEPVEAEGPGQDDAIALPRAEVERRIGLEATRIMTETTLTPVSDGDAVQGFALERIPEGTVLSEAGLKAGDVLQTVNDVPIDSFATLTRLWGQLQGASTIHAQVLRNGEPVSLTIRLTE